MKEARKERVAKRMARLVDGFAGYVDVFDKQVPFTSAQLRLHQETIALRREAGSAKNAIRSSDFLRSLRATLEAWGLGVRGSKLAQEPEFVAALQATGSEIQALDGLLIDDPIPSVDVDNQLWRITESLGVVDNRAKVVADTKTLHHLLPDLVVPMDRMWTGMFFELHPPEWQDPDNQRRTFVRLHRTFSEIARRVDPQQYADGRGWRTSRTKILDNALIGFCKVGSLTEPVENQDDQSGQEVVFTVAGFPPAKSEALSMLGVGHSHSSRGYGVASGGKACAPERGLHSRGGRADFAGSDRLCSCGTGSLGCHELSWWDRRCLGAEVTARGP